MSHHQAAISLTNQQFENNAQRLLFNKKEKKKVDVTGFREELQKNNPQLKVKNLTDDEVYNMARGLVLKQLRKSIPPEK